LKGSTVFTQLTLIGQSCIFALKLNDRIDLTVTLNVPKVKYRMRAKCFRCRKRWSVVLNPLIWALTIEGINRSDRAYSPLLLCPCVVNVLRVVICPQKNLGY